MVEKLSEENRLLVARNQALSEQNENLIQAVQLNQASMNRKEQENDINLQNSQKSVYNDGVELIG